MLLTLAMNNGASMDGVPRGGGAAAGAASKASMLRGMMSWLLGMIGAAFGPLTHSIRS
jgi:hypothetical protein